MGTRRGLLIAGAVIAGSLVGWLLGLDVLFVAPLLGVGLFALGRSVPSWWSAPAAVLVAAAGEAASADDNFVPVLMFMALPYLAGCAVRTRDLLARQLRDQAAELEAEREIYAELSVRYERARIASELHDIVAHAMSVMVVQASAGQRLAAHDPASTAEAFAAISDAARQAEADMRRLVTLLTASEVAASPDLTVVEELVQRAAGSGMDVTLRLEGSREGLSPAAVEIAYAVIRESLTNALRYAAGAPVAVRVDGGGAELVVEVVNGPAASAPALTGHGIGSGLGGLRARVAQAAGRIDAGPTGDGGWRVAARVPRRVPVASAS
jgi:signal transduction histidine kinase